MRTVVAVAALGLTLVPAGWAAKPKPPVFHFRFQPRAIFVPVQQRRERQASCAAEAPRTRLRVVKPRPVACEQPPRANLNVITGGLLASLRP